MDETEKFHPHRHVKNVNTRRARRLRLPKKHRIDPLHQQQSDEACVLRSQRGANLRLIIAVVTALRPLLVDMTAPMTCLQG